MGSARLLLRVAHGLLWMRRLLRMRLLRRLGVWRRRSIAILRLRRHLLRLLGPRVWQTSLGNGAWVWTWRLLLRLLGNVAQERSKVGCAGRGLLHATRA